MFVGHLAVALAARPLAPRVSLGTLIAAAFALDLLWPVFLLAGVEVVAIEPGATAFTPLDFVSYPWTHSLLMAGIWGGLFAVVGGRDRRAALTIAGLVISHWILDFFTHRADLPIWPGGVEVGLGLWNSIPATFAVEGGLFVAAVLAYTRATSPRNAAGRRSLWGLIGLCVVIWIAGPISPPPPSVTAVAIAALALWLFPAWGHWIERNRTRRSS